MNTGMNRKPHQKAGLEWLQPLGNCNILEGLMNQYGSSITHTHIHIASQPRRGKATAGLLRGIVITLAGAFDRRDLKPTSNQQDRAGSPTGREIQGLETAKNLCRTAIANVSNGVNRHAPGGKDYMYSLLKRSLDNYAWRKLWKKY